VPLYTIRMHESFTSRLPFPSPTLSEGRDV
jgi:hypothetical protein